MNKKVAKEGSVKVFRWPCLMSCLAVVLPLVSSSICTAGPSAPNAQGDKDRALAVLEQSVKTDPNNSELWLHLGFAYRKLDKIDQAQSAFEKVTTFDAHSRDALYMLGLIYEKKHDTQK